MKQSISYVVGVIVMICLMLSPLLSCSVLPTPHENFKRAMQSNIGKREDSETSYLLRYPEDVLGSATLPNGNIETEFFQSRKCRVFFEINPATRIIVGWRFEGSERDCVIVP
ncbi:MAG: hypothetical protein LC646_00520 [Xanthomonadaceae bacterium]|nr:hypothetical protein [Xanthomonadaceae bacterium]